MADELKGLDSLSLDTKVKELETIHLLYREFGDLAFRVAEKYYVNGGYLAGYERISKLITKGKFDKEIFDKNPPQGVADFLEGYFRDRGGNMPEIWHEDKVVYLKTAYCKGCLTIEAEKRAPKCHIDICYIYCRAFAKGMVKILEEFFPGLIINFYNVTSRRDGDNLDCLEAFQVISSK